MPNIIIPEVFRKFTNHQAEVFIESGTLKEILGSLATNYPKLKSHLLEEDGRIRSFVSLYLNSKQIYYTTSQDTPLSNDDVLTLLLPLVGG